jgi:MerR family mercuric resistance operon transcriptional regulator
MDPSAPVMTIGALAARSGCKVETIRYYERIGLIAPPARSQGGHRHFGEAAAKRLNFILRSRRLGFTLDAVRVLLALADGHGDSCTQVEGIAAAHLHEVRAKLTDLAALEGVLAGMVERCRSGTLPDCPVIEALYEEA